MEPDTFEGLYKTYFQDVFRYALWLGGDHAEAEEITSTTFFRAWTAAPIRVTTAKSYLLAIARNLFMDARRRERKFVPLDGAASVRTKESNPEVRAQALQLWQALSELEDKYRDPLTLWAGGGLCYQEIAQELKLPLPVVKTRIHRARLLLAAKTEKGD